VAALVGQYYLLLRSVLRTKPLLRRCLVRCTHCRIYFLTHRCNAGRKDVGCPFGCRRVHRKQQSNERSVAYYRDPIGKKKKRALIRAFVPHVHDRARSSKRLCVACSASVLILSNRRDRCRSAQAPLKECEHREHRQQYRDRKYPCMMLPYQLL